MEGWCAFRERWAVFLTEGDVVRQCALLKVVCEVVPFAERQCEDLRACVYTRSVPNTVHEANNMRQLSTCGTQRRCVARLVNHRPCLDLLKVLVGAAGQRRCMPQVFAYLYAHAQCVCTCITSQQKVPPLRKKHHLQKRPLPLKPNHCVHNNYNDCIWNTHTCTLLCCEYSVEQMSLCKLYKLHQTPL